ncbi:MAG: ATP--guanido phosphotransferase [Candidatus Hydrothermales bacterium]
MVPDRFKWMSEKLPFWLRFVSPLYGDIVLSIRMRFARNLKGHNFPLFIDEEKKVKIFNLIKDALFSIDKLKNLKIYEIGELERIEKDFLVERHLISRDLLREGKGSGLAIDMDERISIMVNEEDHLRIQVFYPGFMFEEAFMRIMEIDDLVGSTLEYAYNGRYGFLTSCLSNVGTGFRVSCLLHLPVSFISGRIQDIFKFAASSDVTVRGYYGEGSEVMGNIFQFSSLRTFGKSEEDILSNFKNVVYRIIDIEKEEREKFFKNSRDFIEDRVMRTIGIIKSAKFLSSREVMEYASHLRLAAGMNILNINIEKINEIMLLNQPAHIQILFGKIMEEKERDKFRGILIRTRLNLS